MTRSGVASAVLSRRRAAVAAIAGVAALLVTGTVLGILAVQYAFSGLCSDNDTVAQCNARQPSPGVVVLLCLLALVLTVLMCGFAVRAALAVPCGLTRGSVLTVALVSVVAVGGALGMTARHVGVGYSRCVLLAGVGWVIGAAAWVALARRVTTPP
jgi:hypothetical protein